MKRVSKRLRVVAFTCIALSGLGAADNGNRQSRPDWRTAPAITAYKEFLSRNPHLWTGVTVAIDSQVRLTGGPGATRSEEPPLLFVLDRSVLAHAPSSRFGEFRPYSVADSMALMVSVRMTARERPVKDSVEVTVMASLHHMFSYAVILVVRRRNGWAVSSYYFKES